MTEQPAGIYATILQPYSFPEGKFASMNPDDFAVLHKYFERWNSMDKIVNMEYRNGVIDKFVEFHNLYNQENPTMHLGAREAYHSFTEYLYSDNVLPSLVMMHEWASITKNEEALKKSSAALVVLNDALDRLNKYADTQQPELDLASGRVRKLSKSAALARLMSESIDAKPATIEFLTLMKIARLEARQCIWEYKDAPVDFYISPITGIKYSEFAQAAIEEFKEAKNGIAVPQSFIERLQNTDTKAIVISLDINSTFNTHESFTNTQLLGKVNELIKKFTQTCKLNYPEKDVFIVLNTGRPAPYFWGAVELGLEPIDALRMIGLAESGGAELQTGMERGIALPNVENPAQWKLELDGIKKHISTLTTTPIRFEDKLSMVSLEVAPPNAEQGNWIHSTVTGEPMSDTVIQKQLSEYLYTSLRDTWGEYHKLLQEQSGIAEIDKQFNDFIRRTPESGPDGVRGTSDDLPRELFESIKGILDTHSGEIPERLKYLHGKIETLTQMKDNLVVKFNATAGFVDIMMKHQNKYSGLMRALKKFGYTHKNTVTMHVGDAAVDIMPSELDEHAIPIEENRGADEVYVVGVQNSSQALREHIASREDKGYITARKSASGLIDILEGLIVAVDVRHQKVA